MVIFSCLIKIVSHMVFIYSVVRFRSNDPALNQMVAVLIPDCQPRQVTQFEAEDQQNWEQRTDHESKVFHFLRIHHFRLRPDFRFVISGQQDGHLKDFLLDYCPKRRCPGSRWTRC